MELRRALLLFAIVLGVAAVVAALASPPNRRSESTRATPPPATSGDAGSAPPARIRLDGGRAADTRAIEIGRATTIVVAVDEPGQVQIEGLGLIEAATPQDAAVFDVLTTRRARYQVLFEPAGGVRSRALGELVSHPAK